MQIVAIGGQSDGKSSLLEAFLGFRFNIREVEMGTRRPLICQMVHDKTGEPCCPVLTFKLPSAMNPLSTWHNPDICKSGPTRSWQYS